MSSNQSIIEYIEILLLKHLLNKGKLNKASYDKIRKNYKYSGKEIA